MIEIANISHANFIDSKSRYNNSKVIYWGDRKIITFETYKRKTTGSSEGDRFYVITKGTEFRPDLVALRAYGDVKLWWKIMEANGISDIWDFKSGRNIIIPEALFQ